MAAVQKYSWQWLPIAAKVVCSTPVYSTQEDGISLMDSLLQLYSHLQA